MPRYFGHFPCPRVKPLHFLQILVILLYNRVGTVLECNLKMALLYSTLKSYDVSFLIPSNLLSISIIDSWT